jgi:guanylate kinase
LTPGDFQARVRRGGFYEHALVHGNRYGTPRQAVEEALKRGRSMVLVLDVQGGAAVKRSRPDAALVFLMPPSMAELARRLRRRASEGPAAIRRRLKDAHREIKASKDYDYLVVNDRLEEAVDQVSAIYRAEGLRQASHRQNRVPEGALPKRRGP